MSPVRMNAAPSIMPRKNFVTMSCLENQQCTRPKHTEEKTQRLHLNAVDGEAYSMGSLHRCNPRIQLTQLISVAALL